MSDPSEQPPEYEYDVFISYSSDDRTWVRNELLQRLETAGLRVCIDYRDFQLGKPILLNIEEAAKKSRHTLLVLTPTYVRKDWSNFEQLLLQTRDPTNRSLRCVPLVKVSCELPDRLEILTYLDFVEPDDLELAWTQLLAALGNPLESVRVEVKPEAKPN